VKELPSGFIEVAAAFVGNDEFDGCSTPDLGISGVCLTAVENL
jgi:hypothetical protein